MTSVVARTTLAPYGMKGTAMAISSVLSERSSAASSAIAIISTGKAINMSTIRWMMASVLPPKYPLAKPSKAPMRVPAVEATTPTISEIQAPCSTRLSTSRPSRSVPRWLSPTKGAWYLGPAPILLGSKGAA